MMIPPEKLEILPLTNHVTIPEDYLDEMGHMNIQHYMQIYDRAAWELFTQLGVTPEHVQAERGGMFALQQFIRYLAEVHHGETVSVRSRLLGLSVKRLHFMHFMVNETTGRLASTLETVASYADLNTRRTVALPESIAARISEQLVEHNALDWDAPICGVIQV
jgi:acyl-CoA thioester hydrolase